LRAKIFPFLDFHDGWHWRLGMWGRGRDGFDDGFELLFERAICPGAGEVLLAEAGLARVRF
jgi:hypothetical protein